MGTRCQSASHQAGAMNKCLSRRACPAVQLLAIASSAFLTGCISSTAPVLTGGQPLLGEHPRLQFYTLRDGAAHEPATETFRFTDGRYVPISGTRKDIGPFTLHAFDGGDLIAQSNRPGHPAEYAIARKLADGTYLLFVIDEADADEATRSSIAVRTPPANAASRRKRLCLRLPAPPRPSPTRAAGLLS